MFETGCKQDIIERIFSQLMHGGFELERDDDYLRELMLETVSRDRWLHSAPLIRADAEAQKRHFHILLLVDAGLMAQHGQLFRVTNQGHDFVALTREDDAWKFVKTSLKHVGGASIQMLYRAAEAYALLKLEEAGMKLG